MKNRVYTNYIYNVIYQVVAVLAPIVTAPYISRVLHPDGIGSYQYAYSIVNIFCVIATIGTSSYAMREIAYSQDDMNKRSAVFFDVFSLRIVLCLLACVIYVICFVRNSSDKGLFLILMLQIAGVALDCSWFFQGLEEFKILTIRSLIIRILTVVMVFLFVKTKYDLNKYAWILSLGCLFSSIIPLMNVPKYVHRFDGYKKKWKKHIAPSLSLFLPTIAINVYTSLDKTILGMLSTQEEVGYYSQSESIVKISMLLLTSLGAVLMPRVANLISKKENTEVKKEIIEASRFIFLFGFPMMIGMITIAPLFVPVFLGGGYDKSILILRIMPVLIIIIGTASVTGAAVMIPLGRNNQYTVSVTSGAVINVLLNLCLIPRYDSIGATVATIIAETTVLMLECYFIKDYFNILQAIKQCYKYLFSSLLMGGVVYILQTYCNTGVVQLLLIMLAGSCCYFALLLLLKDSLFISLLQRIKIR